jgi:CheY-like chemotaxis protein/tetratricopeptide (TPR) repeat protein
MMFLKKQPPLNTMKELTGEHLREADKLVRLKRYTEAMQEIESAYKIDPNNMYTRSFLERTQYLIDKEREKKSQVFGGETDMTSEHRMEAISELFASVELFIKEKKYPKALNELAKVFQIDPKNYYAQAFSDRIITLMRAETAARKANTAPPLQFIASDPDTPPSATSAASVREEAPRPSDNIPPPPTIVHREHQREADTPPSTKTITPAHGDVPQQSAANPPVLTPNSEQQEEVRRFTLYRELLKECWTDGVITPEESDMLHHARVQYGISFDTHCQIEVGIKIDAYVDALHIVWLDGVVNDNEQEVLEIMRKKFGITLEEQAAAEERFSAVRTSKQAKPMILIVDSDYNNSICAARALISRGYDVRIERVPDDALHFMTTHTPDLILSEAGFPQLDTDGFDLFQRTRSDERLSQVPFLMMTNSDDGRMMRAGLRMGVDYVIPKPLHIGYMISIVEGKLKSGLKNSDNGTNNILQGKQKTRTLL